MLKMYHFVLLFSLLSLICGCGSQDSSNQPDNEYVEVSHATTGGENDQGNAINGESTIKERSLVVYESVAGDLDAEKEIITKSEIDGSFKAACRVEPDLYVYLGHPRRLEGEWEDGTRWFTSEEQIATIENGIISGWREGTVEIFAQDAAGKTLKEWSVAVTTVNDGRDGTYKDNPNIRNTYENHEMYSGTTVLQMVREQVNTIADFIEFMYLDGLYRNYDSPVMYNQNWTWGIPGDMVIINGGGVSCDITNAAAYVLQYDYEDWGFILRVGEYSHIWNYFYEDGMYHVVDFYRSCYGD